MAVNYTKQLGALAFFTQGTVGYDFYANNDILNRERIGILAGVSAQMSGCQLTPRTSYMRRQSDLQDLNVGVTKNTQEDVSVGLDVVCNGFGRLIPSASVQQTWATNSSNSLFSTDYQSFSANAGLGYQAGSFGTISLVGQYADTQYDNRFIPFLSSLHRDGYKVYSGGLHYERPIGATLEVGASVYQTSLSYDGLGLNFSGITYDGTVTYHPDSRFDVTAHFGRQTSPSERGSYDVDVVDAYYQDPAPTRRELLDAIAAHRERPFDAIAFASPLGVKLFLDEAAAAGAPIRGDDIILGAIGRTTAAALESHGLRAGVIAAEPSLDHLVADLVARLAPGQPVY